MALTKVKVKLKITTNWLPVNTWNYVVDICRYHAYFARYLIPSIKIDQPEYIPLWWCLLLNYNFFSSINHSILNKHEYKMISKVNNSFNALFCYAFYFTFSISLRNIPVESVSLRCYSLFHKTNASSMFS